MSKAENKVQTAIMLALHDYCNQEGMPRLELFPPYANQQGDTLNKFCADLVGRLGNAKLILLEVKELDVNTGEFPAFRHSQHDDNLRFENVGVPLAYAYNTTEILAYHKNPRPSDWVSCTLSTINRSVPSLLPGQSPEMAAHSSLLTWLKGTRGENVSDGLGRVFGAFKSVDQFRNGMLVLLHSIDENILTRLDEDELRKVINHLENKPSLSSKGQENLTRLLGESARVFKMFSPGKKKLTP
ncbi:hypothetical protein [Pseudomonas entomophila]|uniref:Uncharacterized protein n=2 Tax=Pseudomonas entomophila TaxID=312306 RepID=Q1IA10_PSEE4|nr:hypothetical protein [Pseudomonas entomophila]WMW03735.1 hypothetical protein RAH46_15460 [Pseudomonas entomophila]CAK15511.1 hypothetical protein PSEEN2724 [Pseudomonas entomophila L48]